MDKRTHSSAFGDNAFEEPPRKLAREVEHPFTVQVANSTRVYTVRHKRDGSVEKRKAILSIAGAADANTRRY